MYLLLLCQLYAMTFKFVAKLMLIFFSRNSLSHFFYKFFTYTSLLLLPPLFSVCLSILQYIFICINPYNPLFIFVHITYFLSIYPRNRLNT